MLVREGHLEAVGQAPTDAKKEGTDVAFGIEEVFFFNVNFIYPGGSRFKNKNEVSLGGYGYVTQA